MWAQKARSTWITQGDTNTIYFQAVVKQRRARNRIVQIRTIEGNQLEEMGDIENYMVEYFKNQYNETSTKFVQELMKELETLEIPKLDINLQHELDIPVSDAKIKWVVFQLGPYKSPRPDGIPAFFYQELWAYSKARYTQLCPCLIPLRFTSEIPQSNLYYPCS